MGGLLEPDAAKAARPVLRGPGRSNALGLPDQFKHSAAAVSALFHDQNLVSAAGLVPMLRLARRAGLDRLSQSRLSIATDKGANAGAKVLALVAGMLAGADLIDDRNVLRHGGMGRLFEGTYAPSTLGSLLRKIQYGHVRQLGAVASRVLGNLTAAAPVLQVGGAERVMVVHRGGPEHSSPGATHRVCHAPAPSSNGRRRA